MECPLCRELYAGDLRRPKLLPCGHGFCLRCLQGRDRCPRDHRLFSEGGADLPDDEYLLSLLAMPGRNKLAGADAGLRLRCEDCAAGAVELCVDQGHRVGSQRAHWHRQVLDGLQRIAARTDDPEADGEGHDALMRQLAATGGVEVTVDGVGDCEDVWTATVQLGGSMAEWTEEAWALRQLLLQLRAEDQVLDELLPPVVDDVDSEPDMGFGLFAEEPSTAAALAEPEEETTDKRAVVVAAAAAEPPDELDSATDSEDRGFGLVDTPAEPKVRPRTPVLEDDDEELDVTVLTTTTDLSPGRLSRVRRLVGVDCGQESSARLLQAVAPHLEQLQLRGAGRAHLLAAHRMPRLRRLEVSGAALWGDPFLLPALDHGGGLEEVQACLSAPTAASLLLAHHRTLRVARLMAPRPRNKATPSYYGSRAALERCQYRGRGALEDPATHRRSVYFPRRAPGHFPALERVEFHEERSWRFDRQGLPALKEDMRVIREMFPGVPVVLAEETLDWRHF